MWDLLLASAIVLAAGVWAVIRLRQAATGQAPRGCGSCGKNCGCGPRPTEIQGGIQPVKGVCEK